MSKKKIFDMGKNLCNTDWLKIQPLPIINTSTGLGNLQQQMNVFMRQLYDQMIGDFFKFTGITEYQKGFSLEDDNEKDEPGKCIPE